MEELPAGAAESALSRLRTASTSASSRSRFTRDSEVTKEASISFSLSIENESFNRTGRTNTG